MAVPSPKFSISWRSGQAKAYFYQTAFLDISSELEGHRAQRAALAVFGIVFAAFLKNHGHGSQGNYVVHHGGFAIEAFYGRRGGFEADLAAFAFKALQEDVSSPQI